MYLGGDYWPKANVLSIYFPWRDYSRHLCILQMLLVHTRDAAFSSQLALTLGLYLAYPGFIGYGSLFEQFRCGIRITSFSPTVTFPPASVWTQHFFEYKKKTKQKCCRCVDLWTRPQTVFFAGLELRSLAFRVYINIVSL